jgi:carbon monoxide dehydrogenase subunit G
MSSESTVQYYRGIDAGINEERGGHAAGQVLIRSVNFADIEGFIADERWDVAGDYLAAAAADLEAGGADFVVMATNTMHRVAPAIEDALSVPFVHIVDPTAEAIADADPEDVAGRAFEEGKHYAALLQLSVGSVKPSFETVITIDRREMPEMEASGQGQSSNSSFDMDSGMTLVENGDDVDVQWWAETDVFGRIANMGQRIMNPVANRVVKRFFKQVQSQISEVDDDDQGMRDRIRDLL